MRKENQMAKKEKDCFKTAELTQDLGAMGNIRGFTRWARELNWYPFHSEPNRQLWVTPAGAILVVLNDDDGAIDNIIFPERTGPFRIA
jgi:hypothetical protein